MDSQPRETNIELLVENTVLKAVNTASKDFDTKLERQQIKNEELLQRLHDDIVLGQKKATEIAESALARAEAAHSRINGLWVKLFSAIGALSGIPALLIFLIDHRK